MPGRSIICAIAILAFAPQAAAGDRPGGTPRADVLSLLMLDAGATHGTSPRFARVALISTADDAAQPGWEVRLATNFLIERGAASDEWRVPVTAQHRESRLDVRSALSEARAAVPRVSRRRSALDASLVFRLDGREESPAFSLGGGAGTVLAMVQKR